jgi:hypothetical protein
VDIGWRWVIRWWSAGGIHPVGSPNLVHSSSFDVIVPGGGPVGGCRSQCCWKSVTRVALVCWAEERWWARLGIHRPGWRCVDRLAIARDSGRRTCCVAEANAGGQRCGGECGGGGYVVMAEHGVVAGSTCMGFLERAWALQGGDEMETVPARNSAAKGNGRRRGWRRCGEAARCIRW